MKEMASQTDGGLIDVLSNINLSIRQIDILGDGHKVLKVNNPTLDNGKGGKQDGKYFGKLPEDLVDTLPGSVVMPEELAGEFGVEKKNSLDVAERLLSSDFNQKMVFEGEKDGVALRVFHGATNKHALQMAVLNAKGFNDPEIRKVYQGLVAKVMDPVLKFEPDQSDIRIIEDCIASGETVMGLLATMAQKGWDFKGKTIRVDVAVATAQGVLVLQKFAKQNNFKLEINAGYMAFGLSEGVVNEETGVKAHANYLTWDERILDMISNEAKELLEKEAKWQDGKVYVVGDMGDAGKSLSRNYDNKCKWNKFRTEDQHGDRDIGKKVEAGKPDKIDKNQKIAIFLTNGGYWMQALADYFGVLHGYQRAIFSAKRIWSDDEEFGYGVLINNDPPGMFDED